VAHRGDAKPFVSAATQRLTMLMPL
jgi:hypothetical protein